MDSTFIPPDNEPKREEWALINNQQALEYQKFKEFEKQKSREKQQKFRMELDQQNTGRADAVKFQKDQDKKFSQYLRQRAQEMNQKQQQNKMNKMISRRRIEEENQHRLDQSKTASRIREDTSRYTGLEIGGRDDYVRQEKQRQRRQDLVDTLDKQLQMKQSERQMQKMNDKIQSEANLQYQRVLEERGRKQNRYHQNQRVYEHFDSLNHEREERQRSLEQKYVEEASKRRREMQVKKQEETKRKKHLLNNQIKKTLDEQVKFHSQQVVDSKRADPEDHSYKMMGNMFRDRAASYDKKEYYEYLRRQAEEQNYRKKRWNFMNEQEYRYNMNQLKKAVQGSYAHDQYIDRSVNMIGQNRELKGASLNASREDPDSVAVKNKIEGLHHGQPNMRLSMDSSRIHSGKHYVPPVKIN